MGFRDRFYTPQTAKAILSWRIAVGIGHYVNCDDRRIAYGTTGSVVAGLVDNRHGLVRFDGYRYIAEYALRQNPRARMLVLYMTPRIGPLNFPRDGQLAQQ